MLIRVTAAAIFFIAGLCGLSLVEGQVLTGRVSNAVTGEPISGAALMIDETTQGTVTAQDGTFRIPLSDVPAVLVVSHLSFQTARISISQFSENSLEISLEPASHDLGIVNISASAVVEIMKNTSYEVLDFEFIDDNLLLMANENGSIYKPCLLLVNLEGDTLYTLDVDRPGEFFRDFDGNIYYLNSRSAWLVNSENQKLSIKYMMEVNEFLGIYPLIVDLREPYWMVKTYSMQRLKLSYYRYNENDSSLNVFCSIVNQPAIDRARWGSYFDGTDADQQFAALIVNKPVEAPLFRTDSAYILINFLDKKIEFFDTLGNLTAQTKASFMENKSCNGKVYRDRINGEFYTSYEKSGISTLYKINTQTGTATYMAKIPNFVFVENIIIRNSEAFFLYKDKFREEQKKVFRMKL